MSSIMMYFLLIKKKKKKKRSLFKCTSSKLDFQLAHVFFFFLFWLTCQYAMKYFSFYLIN